MNYQLRRDINDLGIFISSDKIIIHLEMLHGWCCSRYNRCLHIICNDFIMWDAVAKTVCVWVGIRTERKAINRNQTHSAIPPSILHIGWNIISYLIPTPFFTRKELLHNIAIVYKLALDILTDHFTGLSPTNRFTRLSLFSFQNNSMWI